MKKTVSLIILTLFLFAPWIKGGKELLPLTIIQLMILIAVVACKFGNVCFPFVRRSKINLALMLFILFIFLSLINSVYFHDSMLVFIRILLLLLLYQVFIYISDDNFNERLIKLIFLLSFVLTVHSIMFPGAKLFPNRNLLSGYIVMGLVIGLSRLMICIKDWIYDGRYGRISLYIVSIAIMFMRLISLDSRGGGPQPGCGCWFFTGAEIPQKRYCCDSDYYGYTPGSITCS